MHSQIAENNNRRNPTENINFDKSKLISVNKFSDFSVTVSKSAEQERFQIYFSILLWQ